MRQSRKRRAERLAEEGAIDRIGSGAGNRLVEKSRQIEKVWNFQWGKLWGVELKAIIKIISNYP